MIILADSRLEIQNSFMLLGIEESILSYTAKYKSAFGTVPRIAPVTPRYRSAGPLKNQLSTPTGPIPICFEIIFLFHLRSFFVGSRICILVFTVSTGWPQTCNRDGINLLLNQGGQKLEPLEYSTNCKSSLQK